MYTILLYLYTYLFILCYCVYCFNVFRYLYVISTYCKNTSKTKTAKDKRIFWDGMVCFENFCAIPLYLVLCDVR